MTPTAKRLKPEYLALLKRARGEKVEETKTEKQEKEND